MANFTSRRMALKTNSYMMRHCALTPFPAVTGSLGFGLRDSSANQAQKPQPMPAQWSWPISRKPETRT